MPSQEPINLFVYGTLTDPERVAALTNKRYVQVKATLSGFQRVNSPLGYPFILNNTKGTVHGVLLLKVDAISLAQLDAYEDEGRLYRRQAVTVQVAGQEVAAMTYVGHEIAATVPQKAARRADQSHPEGCPEASAPGACAPALFVDEH